MSGARLQGGTGIRGEAADSERDVDLSNTELLSISPSRPLPIL